MARRVVYVRTTSRDIPPETLENALVVGDFHPDGTVSHSLERLVPHTGEPPAVARDFFTLAAAVYVADKKTPRSWWPDAWTREFEVRVPVVDPDLWRDATPLLEEALEFLTGDSWRLRFRQGRRRPQAYRLGEIPFDLVALFSGGVDSLVGAIDVLATSDERVLLVGHHDSNMTQGPQDTLFSSLARKFGERVRFVAVGAKPNASQYLPYPLDRRVKETTTRSRSLLFIAIALVAAAALGGHVPIRIPENGLIALNVPLVPERSGTCSTRTTHPFFLDRLQQAFNALDMRNRIENPYLLRTKGEMLAGCADDALLSQIAPRSVSCSHPEQGRFDAGPGFAENCGYCFPCLIRRAAFHAIGRDRAVDYRHDVLKDSAFFVKMRGRDLRNRGRDLRAVLAAISEPESDLGSSPLLSGPIPPSVARADLALLHRRGLAELRALVTDKGGEQVYGYAGLT